jgi:hypothetical protein
LPIAEVDGFKGLLGGLYCKATQLGLVGNNSTNYIALSIKVVYTTSFKGIGFFRVNKIILLDIRRLPPYLLIILLLLLLLICTFTILVFN